MPDRVYLQIPPYRLWHRFLAHPGSGVLAVWSFLAGLVMLVDSQVVGLQLSTTLAVLPDVYKLWISVSLIIGGAMASAGLLLNWTRLDRSWRWERSGWWILLGAWLTLSATAAIHTPLGVIAWGDFLAFAVMAFVRQAAIARIEKRTRASMESLA